jgi:hypothetical protein
MHDLFTRNHGGILGDDMGLGEQHRVIAPSSNARV